MADSLEIREFEPIFCEEDIEAGEGEHAVSRAVFDALETFVLENRGSEEDDVEGIELMSLSARKRNGKTAKTIAAKNYVGLIELKDGTSIQIRPKLDVGGSDADERKVFLKMLQAVVDLPFKQFEAQKIDTAKMNIFDALILMFAREAERLVKRGLKSDYMAAEGNERFVKGKLDFTNHVKYNAAHKERFYVRYDEFSINRPENRLVKRTLEVLKRKARSGQARREVVTALTLFAEVPASKDVARDFSRCKFDRTMDSYTRILKWAEVFLRGESFTSFKGSEVAYSLLFPMDKLFEAYVVQELKRAAARSGSGWRVIAQEKEKWLFDAPSRRYRLQPDIVARKNGGDGDDCSTLVILDTKWKRVCKGWKPSGADMYQMCAYQHRYDATKVILVYPRSEEAQDANVQADYLSENTHVQVFLFDLANAEKASEELLNLIEFE